MEGKERKAVPSQGSALNRMNSDDEQSSQQLQSYTNSLAVRQEIQNCLKKKLLTDLLDEIILGLCFDAHRGAKLGFLFLDETSKEEDRKYAIVDERGLDVFGKAASLALKKQIEKPIDCPNCQRSLAALRFAPHLEKCMGMGRNSSRLASKRIASATSKSASTGGGESEVEDDLEKDSDWTSSYASNRDKEKRVKKKSKNGLLGNGFFKRSRKNANSNSGTTNTSTSSAINGSYQESSSGASSPMTYGLSSTTITSSPGPEGGFPESYEKSAWGDVII